MMDTRMIDETGNKYGCLVVLRLSGKRKRNKPTWLCQCVCGKTHEALGQPLRAGRVKSCGCYKLAHLPKRRFFGRKNPLDMVDDDII